MNKIQLSIKLILAIFMNIFSDKKLYYITESADWVIKNIGQMITLHIKNKLQSSITITHYGIRNSIIHYGSISTFLGHNKIKLPHKSNKIIVTWFHIVPNDERINSLAKYMKYVDIWHTSCQITKNKMINLGIPNRKIIVIPLGIDLKHFRKSSNEDKIILRQKFKIPKNKIVIGSFQKDSNGWGEGLEPKLIKGPDIFCEVIEKLAKKYEIFVLLTGPARGYVKNRLDILDIPYKHDFLENPNEVADYFKACDLYIITSREEGGPKSVLESMACGVPLISTKVGMAPDMIKDGENGFLVNIEDVDDLYNKASHVIDNNKLQTQLILNGLRVIKNYDWYIISNKYYENLYKELL